MTWRKYDANGIPLELSVEADTYTPTARVRHSVDQSISNGVFTTLSFDTEDFDTNSIHDPVTNNSRITCQAAGKYLIGFSIYWSGGISGSAQRRVDLVKNGTTSMGRDVSGGASNRLAVVLDMVVGDYFHLSAYQESGGVLNVLSLGGESPIFYMTRIGPSLVVSSAGGGANFVTSLPSSPGDGKEVIYEADGANGVYWHLKYKDSSARWHFIGGADLYAESAGGESTGSGSYVDPGTGPNITVPLEGDYDIEIGGYFSSGSTGGNAYMSYAIGATAASDNDALIYQNPTTGTSSYGMNSNEARLRRKTGLAASTALSSRIKGVSNTFNFYNRWMRVRPVRLD